MLTSSGVANDAIEAALAGLAGKPKSEISFAVINEAYAVGPGDKRWVIDELHGLAERFGGRIDMVNLLALSPAAIKERLANADVIYVLGGHTDYLQDVFDRSGLTAMLPELLEKRVYVGSSAGSMVMGKRISAEAYRQLYGEEGEYGITNYLNLVDFSLTPHFNSPVFPNNRANTLAAMIAASGDKSFLSLYAIDDATAIQVADGEVKILSAGDWKLYNEEAIPQ